MSKPRILVLCCGAGSVAIPFLDHGWEVTGVDINPQIEPREGLTIIQADIRNLNPNDFETFDAIWFSPPCERFSKAARRFRHFDTTGDPIWPALTNGAIEAIEIVEAGMRFMRLARFWWMENPVGAMRHIAATQGLNRVTIDYCMYNDRRKKPTDLFGDFPSSFNSRLRCEHPPDYHTPLSAINGYLTRSAIPVELVLDVMDSLES